MRQLNSRRQAMAIADVIVTCAVAFLLLVFIVMAVDWIRAKSLRSSVKNDLRRQGIAVGNYVSTHNAFPFRK